MFSCSFIFHLIFIIGCCSCSTCSLCLFAKRDEKIQKEIIEPKDKIIDMLYSDNIKLHQELEKQINVIDKAEKSENERQSILQEKLNLENIWVIANEGNRLKFPSVCLPLIVIVTAIFSLVLSDLTQSIFF